jgi:predicted Holliday junction resolvase-like endonuclease
MFVCYTTYMNSLLKSDIFFFITSVAVVLLTVLLCILVFYLIKVSKDIKYISQKAKSEADNVLNDISELREGVKQQGQNLKNILNFFSQSKAKTKKSKEQDNG